MVAGGARWAWGKTGRTLDYDGGRHDGASNYSAARTGAVRRHGAAQLVRGVTAGRNSDDLGGVERRKEGTGPHAL